jgi:hypothetical protein
LDLVVTTLSELEKAFKCLLVIFMFFALFIVIYYINQRNSPFLN